MKKLVLSVMLASFIFVFTYWNGLSSSDSTISKDSYYLSSNAELTKNDEEIFATPVVMLNGDGVTKSFNSAKPLYLSSNANNSGVTINVGIDEEYKTVYDAVSAATTDNTITIKLMTDVVETTTINISNKTIDLDLNDHELSWNKSTSLFFIETGGTLNLRDNGTHITKFKQSNDDEYHRYWIKDSNGDKTVTGGYILGGINLNANSLIQVNGGTFNMYGGTIVGTRNNSGGWSTAGVWVQTGTFNMYGGAFKGCNARDGVIESSGNASATIKIYDDAIIENCVSFNCAGALFLRGNTDFYMYGGTIKDCVAKLHGGAINAKGENCNVHLYGGQIVNNKAGDFGGGITIEDNNVHITAGGNMYIAENSLTNGQADNLWLGGGNTISLGTGDNVPREGMHIGIATQTAPTASAPVKFTTDVASTDIDYFTSDNPVYAVQHVSNHLELVKNWTALQNALNGTTTLTIDGLFEINNGTIKLLTDFKAGTGDTTLVVSGTKTLDLNGHVIDGKISDSASVGSVITVNSDANLTLNDSNPNVAHYFDYVVDGAWTLNTTATEGTPIENLTDRPADDIVIKVNGGCITGGENLSDGGGIKVNGALTMLGGNIIGNQTKLSGGGVNADMYNSRIDIQGGAIIGNKSEANGGGVFSAGGTSSTQKGTLMMSGGSVLFNTAVGCGGITVHRGSNFTMSGGSIIGNKGGNNDQGGVFLSGSSGNFTMTGGIIKNNIGVQYGGVYSAPGANKVTTIGGTAKIIGNKLTDGTVSNFYLSDGTTVTLGAGGDAPKDGMNVGVTTQTVPTDTTSVKITTGGAVEDIKYFTADNTNYVVMFNTNHLELAKIVAYNDTKKNGYITLVEAISEADSGDEIELWTYENTENVVLPDGVTLYAKSGYTGTVTTNEIGKYVVKQDMFGEYQYKFFVADVLTITYKDQGNKTFSGTHESGYPTTFMAEEPIELKSATKTNYTFGGWYDNTDCTGDPITGFNANTHTNDLTLYAKWIANEYKVTFDKNGGIGSMDDVSGLIGNYTLPDCEFIAPDNKQFKGWSLSSDGEIITKLNIDEDKIVYAIWEDIPDDYTYKFLEGDNQELTIDNIDEYKFRIDGDYSLFESVEIGDLELVEDEDYIVTEGSTIITFTKKGIAKLNTLEKGIYNILVTYSNGKNAKGSLILNKILPQNPDIPNPKTGDNINYYILIGITSLLGLIGSAFMLERKYINKYNER